MEAKCELKRDASSCEGKHYPCMHFSTMSQLHSQHSLHFLQFSIGPQGTKVLSILVSKN